jgi:phosphopentomutase
MTVLESYRGIPFTLDLLYCGIHPSRDKEYHTGMKSHIIVLDSVGVGALPDAHLFSASPEHPRGDEGSHTINHILEQTGIQLPNLEQLGLGHIPSVHAKKVAQPSGSFGRMLEVSKGKDTSTGHWEFMGIHLENPFQVFPQGFPQPVMEAFSAAIGRGWLCNKPYSGTDVIRDFGAAHLESGAAICYTSADSVFQIAAHLDCVPLETLYGWCKAARQILQGEYAVARVIARPFRGVHPFERAGEHRKDYSLEPPHNALDALFAAGLDVIGLGKIPDIYAGRGFTQSIHTDNNEDGIEKMLAVMQSDFHGLAFLNLVDFDAKYGHRRDVAGYAQALVDFDARLPEILSLVGQDDVLHIVSDHGNDPTWFGSDHTREYAMLLEYRPNAVARDLGERGSFADLAATVCKNLGVAWAGHGEAW